MILDSTPRPNQITNSGATAILGIELKAASSGITIERSTGT